MAEKDKMVTALVEKEVYQAIETERGYEARSSFIRRILVSYLISTRRYPQLKDDG
jgi:metal-responsive CopG/Arc/MetJ family transcriptional regulator